MSIREARPEDAPRMARVRIDTWRDAYRGIVPDDYLDSMSYEATENFLRQVLWENNRGSFAFVAEDAAGEVVGIAIAGAVLGAKEEVYRGEIYILYVLPSHQRQGHGRGLVRACALGLVQRGLTPIMLWTFAENVARGFYEALGGVVVHSKEEDMGGKRVIEVAYGWLDPNPLYTHGLSK
jgi:ribosomal protein S18 acetylase RimI-like enzyme